MIQLRYRLHPSDFLFLSGSVESAAKKHKISSTSKGSQPSQQAEMQEGEGDDDDEMEKKTNKASAKQPTKATSRDSSEDGPAWKKAKKRLKYADAVSDARDFVSTFQVAAIVPSQIVTILLSHVFCFVQLIW